MVIGNCVRLKCDAPKCNEVVHISLPHPIPTNLSVFTGAFLGGLTEQGWVVSDITDMKKHFCYKHGVGAELDKEVS